MTRFVDNKLTLREWLPLIGITVSAFIFNTSEFMPVGLLTGIGASFGTSEGVTGLIISVYAWAVMLLWSKPWLDRFAMGPAEWAWRSLQRGKLQKIRRSA